MTDIITTVLGLYNLDPATHVNPTYDRSVLEKREKRVPAQGRVILFK